MKLGFSIPIFSIPIFLFTSVSNSANVKYEFFTSRNVFFELFGMLNELSTTIAEAFVSFKYFEYLLLLRNVISPSLAFSIEETPLMISFSSPIIFPSNISARFLILKSILFIAFSFIFGINI